MRWGASRSSMPDTCGSSGGNSGSSGSAPLRESCAMGWSGSAGGPSSLSDGPARPHVVSCPQSTIDAGENQYTLARHARLESEAPKLEAMLYQIYDWQRAAMEPWRLFAQTANELYGHPT